MDYIQEAITFYRNYFKGTFISIGDLDKRVYYKTAAITYDKREAYVDASSLLDEDIVLVSSGEQSFLEKVLDDSNCMLSPGHVYGGYCACNRPTDTIDMYHTDVFNKAELFAYVLIDDERLELLHHYLQVALETSVQCFNNLGLSAEDLEVVYRPNPKQGKCEEIINLDILCKGIELGSYGIRKYGEIYWLYGTIMADYRFKAVLRLNQDYGYHRTFIPKGVLGTTSKITEEYREFLDAKEQDNIVMQFVELSDLIGAVEAYIKYYNLELQDLITMKDATKRAFESGSRS